MGLPGDYISAAVAPGVLSAFLAAMPAAGLVGGNVTVPHKEAAAALCAHLTPAAARLDDRVAPHGQVVRQDAAGMFFVLREQEALGFVGHGWANGAGRGANR